MRPCQQPLPLPLLLLLHPLISPPGHVSDGVFQLMKIDSGIQILADEEIGLFITAGDGGDAHSRVGQEGVADGVGVGIEVVIVVGGGGIFGMGCDGKFRGGRIHRSSTTAVMIIMIIMSLFIMIRSGSSSSRETFVISQNIVIDLALLLDDLGIDPLDVVSYAAAHAASLPRRRMISISVAPLVRRRVMGDHQIRRQDGSVAGRLSGRVGRPVVEDEGAIADDLVGFEAARTV
mmetsp:Transcript_20774/g.43764  ORF Transcript_20774/g.43764 Transcript_20774/m.43764 type:complete len:233 (-) Transcript_20774:762-1460(-)